MMETHKAAIKGHHEHGWIVLLRDIPDDQAEVFALHKKQCGVPTYNTTIGPAVPATAYEYWLSEWAEQNKLTIVYGGHERA